jgi:hypothetical protein
MYEAKQRHYDGKSEAPALQAVNRAVD